MEIVMNVENGGKKGVKRGPDISDSQTAKHMYTRVRTVAQVVYFSLNILNDDALDALLMFSKC